MKSEKAKNLLDDSSWKVEVDYETGEMDTTEYGYALRQEDAVYAVEIAEQEAEERMRKELTRWHDPKVELPPTEKIVLVKTTYGCGYALAERDDEGWWLAPPEEWELPAERVVGWRDIHKNK